MIRNFSDFCTELIASGFSMGGGNAKGIYAVIPYDWTEQEAVDSPVKWHTGDPETDPWEWRMRGCLADKRGEEGIFNCSDSLKENTSIYTRK